jgi:hypothetical protein
VVKQLERADLASVKLRTCDAVVDWVSAVLQATAEIVSGLFSWLVSSMVLSRYAVAVAPVPPPP